MSRVLAGPWWSGEEVVAWPHPPSSETLPPGWPLCRGTLTDLLPLTQHLSDKGSSSFKHPVLKSCLHFESNSTFQSSRIGLTRNYSWTLCPQPREQALESCSFCVLVADQGTWSLVGVGGCLSRAHLLIGCLELCLEAQEFLTHIQVPCTGHLIHVAPQPERAPETELPMS